MFQASAYSCNPACDGDDPAAVVPGADRQLASGTTIWNDWWRGTAPSPQAYLSRSGGSIDIPIVIGKYLGPVDADGHPVAGHALYQSKVSLLIQAYDVDSDCGTAPCEQDTVFVNGTFVGALTGYNDAYHTSGILVPASLLNFRHTYLDAPNGVNDIEIRLDQTSTSDHWYAAVADAAFRLPPAPETLRPVVLLHGLNGIAPTGTALSEMQGYLSQHGFDGALLNPQMTPLGRLNVDLVIAGTQIAVPARPEPVSITSTFSVRSMGDVVAARIRIGAPRAGGEGHYDGDP